MSENIAVNHGTIEQQGTALAKMKNELEGDFDRALKQVQALHESGAFKGSAGATFQTKYDEWHKSITTTLRLMEEFGAHLGKASKAFADVDSSFSLK